MLRKHIPSDDQINWLCEKIDEIILKVDIQHVSGNCMINDTFGEEITHSPDELHISRRVGIFFHHRNEKRRLASLSVVYSSTVGYKAKLFDKRKKVHDESFCCVFHPANKKASDCPVGIPRSQ